MTKNGTRRAAGDLAGPDRDGQHRGAGAPTGTTNTARGADAADGVMDVVGVANGAMIAAHGAGGPDRAGRCRGMGAADGTTHCPGNGRLVFVPGWGGVAWPNPDGRRRGVTGGGC
jgi:hypothetical protein